MGDIILSRPGENVLNFLDYGIYVDGNKVNFISDDKRKVLKLEEGHHEIYIKVINAKSNNLNINIKKNQTVRLVCGIKLKGIKKLFAMFYLLSGKLLELDFIK